MNRRHGRYAASEARLARAAGIPGNSLTRSKAPGVMFDVGKGPIYAMSVRGSTLVDIDGNPYIDMLCALGAVSLGYDAVSYESGVLSLPSYLEPECAELVLHFVAPWATHVRFVKTGSEATSGALMVAKRATKRQFAMRLRGSYHGWHECWQDDNPAMFWVTGSESDVFLRTMLLQCAAFFIEPPRWQQFERDWLERLVSLARESGALVVFDEMIYGGRWALGGASEYYDIQPDLACYGKALGNGAAVAFVVGGEALADHGTCISGTYSGDTVGLAAVQRTVWRYQALTLPPVIATLWERGRQLQNGLREQGWTVEGAPVHQRIVFETAEAGKTFAAGMAARGVLWHPACVNVSAAHTEDDINRVLAAAKELR